MDKETDDLIHIKYHDQSHHLVRLIGMKPTMESAMRYAGDYYNRNGGCVQLVAGRDVLYTFGELRQW